MNPSWDVLTIGDVLSYCTIAGAILAAVQAYSLQRRGNGSDIERILNGVRGPRWLQRFIAGLTASLPFFFLAMFFFVLYGLLPILHVRRDVAVLLAYCGYWSAGVATIIVFILLVVSMISSLKHRFLSWLFLKLSEYERGKGTDSNGR